MNLTFKSSKGPVKVSKHTVLPGGPYANEAVICKRQINISQKMISTSTKHHTYISIIHKNRRYYFLQKKKKKKRRFQLPIMTVKYKLPVSYKV